MVAARNLCCRHRHNRRSDVAVPATGHITPSRINGDRFLAGDEAGNNLILNIADCGLLRLGKPFDVIMGELNILFQLLWHQRCGRCDLFRGQDHIAIVFVELRRIFQRLGVSAFLNVVENALHDVLDIRCAGLRCEGRLFEILKCHERFALPLREKMHAGAKIRPQ